MIKTVMIWVLVVCSRGPRSKGCLLYLFLGFPCWNLNPLPRYVMFYPLDISNNWEVHALAFLSLFPTHSLNRAVDPLQISICSTMHCNLTFVSWKSQWLVTRSIYKIWPVWWSSPIHLIHSDEFILHHMWSSSSLFKSSCFVSWICICFSHIYIYLEPNWSSF